MQAVCVLAWACGDSAVFPDRRVVAVNTSRDSVYLDIGDSALVQAEARDATGDVILEAIIEWRALAAGVATVVPGGRTARVVATGAGNGRVVASAGTHTDTISVTVLPPITTTTLAIHADTAWALSDELRIGVTSQSATGARFGRYTAVSRSNVIWTWYDEEAHAVRAIAQLPGETYVVVAERRGTTDSVLIVVLQRPAQVTITPSPLGGFLDRGRAVTASVLDARHNLIPAQSVVWTSVDATIAAVDSSGFVSFDGVGTTTIVATHATGLTDSAHVTVLPYPKLSLWNLAVGHSHDTLTVGMHQLSDTFYVSADNAAVSPWVHLRIIDTGIATAPDSVLYVGGGGTFRAHGRRPGRTLLIGEAPLMVSDSVHIHVVPSRLAVVDPLDPVPLALKGTDNVRFGIMTLDSFGTPRPIADTLRVAIRSSDSTIIDLFQTPDTFVIAPPGGPSMTVFSAHALDTGTAVIRATAVDYAPDSMVWRVLAGPKLRFVQGGRQMLGAGQSASGWIVTVGPAFPPDSIVVTLTQRHPATVTLPSSLTLTGFTGTGFTAGLTMNALLPGTDTIIAAAAGHEPDTAIITVTTPRILLPDTMRGTTLGVAAVALVGDSLGNPHPPTGELLLLATSNDTTVVADTSIRVPLYVAVTWFVFPAVDTGVATVTVRDSAALYPPKFVTVIVGLDSSLHVVNADGNQYGPAATGQRFEDGRFRITHPWIMDHPRTVWLSTTVPGVLRIPDSIMIQGANYTLFTGVGGDFPGTTRIVATARGFRADTSGPIAVGQGHLSLQVPDTVFVGGIGYAAIVSALSPLGARLPDQRLDATLVPLDSGIAPTSATIQAGAAESPPTTLEFTAPGTLRLGVLDQRPVPTPFAGDTVSIVARLPWLLAGAPGTGPAMTVGVGQRLSAIIARPGNTVSGAAVVSVTHLGSRTVSSPSAVLPAGASSVPYSIEGRTIGVDTMLLAATGYQSDSGVVTVTDGRVQVLNWRSLLVVGDSAPIQLLALDSLSVPHSVVARTTFAMQISGGLTFSNGAQPISSISVAADSAITARFYVKATTAGPADVQFVNLNYLPRTFQINVVNRPLAAPPQSR